MRRILQLDIVLFSLGFVLGAALDSRAVGCAVVGLVASVLHRGIYERPAVALPMGLCAAIVWVNATADEVTHLERALDGGPQDLLLSGQLVDGPRAFPDGEGFELRVDDVDNRPDEVTARLYARGHSDAIAGERVRVFARCDLFDPEEFPGDRGSARRWAARGVFARCSAADAIVREGPATGVVAALRRAMTRRRLSVEADLRRVLGRRSGVPIAMLTGTRGLVTDSEQRAHQRAGTAHLLAISGVHFGALSTLVWFVAGFVLRRCPRVTRTLGARRGSAGIVLLTMLGYLLLVGAPISATRAFVAMAAIALGLLLGRRASGVASVATAATVIVASAPGVVWDLGFQLSFAATAAIVLFWLRMPSIVEHEPYAFEAPSRRTLLARAALRFVLMSWAATTVTGPIILGALGELSVVGLLTNLFAVPIVSLAIFPALLFGTALTGVIPSIGEPTLWWATEAMLRVTLMVEECATWPGAVLNPGIAPNWWVVWTVASVFAVIGDRGRMRTFALATIGIGLATAAAYRPLPPAWRIHFIPVGQGDATLVEAPSGHRVLIDAGGATFGRDPGRWIVVPYLRRLGIHRLDAIVVTHGDTDHCGGVPAVLENIDVNRVVLDPANLNIDGLQLTRWHVGGSRNNQSIIATIRAGPAVAMLTGDAESEAEAQWLDAKPHRVHILKIGHHGSRTSSTAPFLDEAGPVVGVVSAGRHNRFGHPHAVVVRRLDARAVRRFSTAENGLVVISIDSGGVITSQVRRPKSVATVRDER